MSQIIPNLWIASLEDVKSHKFLKSIGATHILNCTDEIPTKVYGDYPLKEFVQVHLTEEEDRAAEMQICAAAGHIQRWMKPVLEAKSNDVIVCHCKGGINRSPTAVVAWFQIFRETPFDTAYSIVAKARPCIRINDYYLGILKGI